MEDSIDSKNLLSTEDSIDYYKLIFAKTLCIQSLSKIALICYLRKIAGLYYKLLSAKMYIILNHVIVSSIALWTKNILLLQISSMIGKKKILLSAFDT